MGNSFANLPSQAANGSGAAVDLSTMGAEKTFIVSGTWVIPPSITVEMNDDPGQAGTWAPVKTFQGSGQITVALVGKWFRVTVAGFVSGQAPDVNVGGDDATTTITAMTVPAQNGVGAALDVSGFGQFKTVSINDDFTGNLTIEMSTDGTSDWAPMLSFVAPGQQSTSNTAHWVRVSRSGFTSGGTPTVFIGAVDPSAAIDGVIVENAGVALPGVYQTLNLLGGTITAVDQGGGVAGISASVPAGSVTVRQNGVDVVVSATVINVLTPGLSVANVGGVATLTSGIAAQDEGVPVITSDTMNFVGAGVTTTNVGGVITVTIPGGVAGVAIQDEGVPVVTSATLNFVGAGVTATNVGGIATITVPGGITGVAWQDEGIAVVTSATANFVGAGIALTNVGGVATVTMTSLAVQDEGIGVVAQALTMNFVGAGVTATNVGGVATVTIPGGIAGVAWQDEGGAVVTSATANFVGAGVTCTNVGGVATVTIPGGISGVAFQDEGIAVVTSSTANFVGAGVACTNVGGVATITVTSLAVQDEGIGVVTSALTMNFVGAGVTATNVGGVATVTIPGGISGVAIQEEGGAVVTTSTINFVGAAVTATNVGGVGTITVPGQATYLPEQWVTQNVPANVSNAAMSAQVSTNFDTFKAVRAGSIIGLVTRLTEAVTGGTLTVTVTINGVAKTLAIASTSGSNASGGTATQAPGVDTYVAGDLIGVQRTTNNTFLPVTTDLEAAVQVFESL